MSDPVLEKLLEFEQTAWQAVVDKNGEALSDFFNSDYIEVTADGNRYRKNVIVENSPKVDDIESYKIRSARLSASVRMPRFSVIT